MVLILPHAIYEWRGYDGFDKLLVHDEPQWLYDNLQIWGKEVHIWGTNA